MSVAWPLVLVLAALGIAVAYLYNRLRLSKQRKPTLLAEVATLSILPSYKKEKKKADRLRYLRQGLLVALMVVLVVVAARPTSSSRILDEEFARDIVFCMDISGSMDEYVSETVKQVRKIVTSNKGDRYGIVVFRDAPFVVMPLTRDTVALERKLDEMDERLLTDDFADPWASIGIAPGGGGGTDIAEGLQGCVNRFDQLEKLRSRHIVILTDMEHFQGQLDPLVVAEKLAAHDVRLHIMKAALEFDFSTSDDELTEQLKAITNGTVTDVSSAGASQDVLSEVLKTIQSGRQIEDVAVVDQPFLPIMIAGLLIAVWFVVDSKYRGEL